MHNGATFQQVLDEVIRISNNDESKVNSVLEMLRQPKKTPIIEVKKSKRKIML
ncbi:MAG TPA: hypothetical protein VFJ51_10245 [Nitrososphaeraceae archaeon]|nr:hypothetical protein [Nitrososphaeraceae archaeon]